MKVEFLLNGNHVEVDVPPNEVLLDTLRLRLGVKGVKRGCERAECGTCTVLLNGKPVYSCSIFTVQVEGQSVETIEKIVQTELGREIASKLSAVGGIQCGYCTPGFVTTAYALLKEKSSPSSEEILKAIEGNLCRCTGYKKILEALEEVSAGRRPK